MERTYRFADVNVRIAPVHGEVLAFCSGYEWDGPADFSAETTQADIDRERARGDGGNYSDAYLESLAVYRRIAEKMPEYGAFLFHGSAIAVDGAAYLFTAKSGTGKSTHARLWRELLGDRAAMVNDDKPLIRVRSDGTATVYGTPWNGKHRLGGNVSAPLRAVCILERAEENRIRAVSRQEALPMLIQQAYRPADPAALARTLEMIDRMNVRLYRLGCNMDIGAAELAYNAMKEESL